MLWGQREMSQKISQPPSNNKVSAKNIKKYENNKIFVIDRKFQSMKSNRV